MKNWIIALVILIVGIGIVLEARYDLIVDSPIVVKLDHLTGDAWIVNGGVWRKVQCEPKECALPPAEKASSVKTNKDAK